MGRARSKRARASRVSSARSRMLHEWSCKADVGKRRLVNHIRANYTNPCTQGARNVTLVQVCRRAAVHSRASLVIFWLASALLIGSAAHSATLPSGFAETRIATGIASPTALSVAPDGRLFVSEQGGRLRVIKNGALLATPFLTLNVDSSGERGLLGVAFDPNFATNNFVYVYPARSGSRTAAKPLPMSSIA
jgi:glucose/arabinose dehydrogenase